jgi:hypothetical protein
MERPDRAAFIGILSQGVLPQALDCSAGITFEYDYRGKGVERLSAFWVLPALESGRAFSAL